MANIDIDIEQIMTHAIHLAVIFGKIVDCGSVP